MDGPYGVITSIMHNLAPTSSVKVMIANNFFWKFCRRLGIKIMIFPLFGFYFGIGNCSFMNANEKLEVKLNTMDV